MADQILGRWELVSSDKYEDYLKAAGMCMTIIFGVRFAIILNGRFFIVYK